MIFPSGVCISVSQCYRSDSDFNMQDLHAKLICFIVEIGIRSLACFTIYLFI